MAVGTLALSLSLGFSGIAGGARADVSPGPASQPMAVGRSVTHGHVFMFTSQGLVDVTGSLDVYGDQTYLTDDSECIPIYMDYFSGIVFDGAGTVLGLVDLS
jgi:hypothetical protein